MRRSGVLYGLMAEFEHAEELLEAARRTHQAGYRRIDAYSPMALEGLSEAIGFPRTRLPIIVLVGGIVGAVSGYFMQYYASVIAYPIIVGGKPLHSWPMFIPITFEMTILVGSLTAFLAMWALNGLPQLYHPVFNVPRFSEASRDRFFLVIEARDARFERGATRAFLESLHPQEVFDVEQ
jgi:hypothetical protein